MSRLRRILIGLVLMLSATSLGQPVRADATTPQTPTLESFTLSDRSLTAGETLRFIYAATKGTDSPLTIKLSSPPPPGEFSTSHAPTHPAGAR